MKATKDYISLETGILLKNCGIPTLYLVGENQIPIYTRQEILREYPKEFLGDEYRMYGKTYNSKPNIKLKKYMGNATRILSFLQHYKYEEADLYFRENCILIK